LIFSKNGSSTRVSFRQSSSSRRHRASDLSAPTSLSPPPPSSPHPGHPRFLTSPGNPNHAAAIAPDSFSSCPR
jgi:hypothetical protein